MNRAVSVAGIETQSLDYMEAEVIALEREAQVLVRTDAFTVYVGNEDNGDLYQIIASSLGGSLILRFPFASRAQSS